MATLATVWGTPANVGNDAVLGVAGGGGGGGGVDPMVPPV